MGYMTTNSVTCRGHVTKRGINTRRPATNFSCSILLTCLITRGRTLLPLTSNFSSLLTLPIFLFSGACGMSLRKCQIVSQPKYNCIFSKLFYDNSKLCLSQNSIASYRSSSNTIPICVLAEFQLHIIEIFLRHFRNVS